MILPMLTDIPQQEMNYFECISIPNEIYMPTKEVPVIDYLITIYPRNEGKSPFSFVYGLFDSKSIVFSNNQDTILNTANSMFAGSLPLNQFEQSVLNTTFKKSIKDKPTLSGRK